MNVKLVDIMRQPVMTTTPHQTAHRARRVMLEHDVSALPVVGPDGEPVGMVTSSDMLAHPPDGAPVSSFMSTPVVSVPAGEQPHVAARVMRNRRIHHLVVTEHDRVVGIVSAYDLLALVEEHRYVAKQPPTPSRKVAARR